MAAGMMMPTNLYINYRNIWAPPAANTLWELVIGGYFDFKTGKIIF
jgi:hypothetical protein